MNRALRKAFAWTFWRSRHRISRLSSRFCGSARDTRIFTNGGISATPTVIMPCDKLWNTTSKPRLSGHPETTTRSCAGIPVRVCSCKIRRSAPCRIRSFNRLLASSGERFAKIVRDLIDEAMDGRFGDAMPGDCVDGPAQWTERRFVKPAKIQLGFGAGQRINRKLSLHER